MSRTRTPLIPIDQDTPDRRGVLRWLGKRKLSEAAPLLDCNTAYLSSWLRHKREISDKRIAHWSQVTGVTPRIFLEGRYASRALAKRLGAKAA